MLRGIARSIPVYNVTLEMFKVLDLLLCNDMKYALK